MIRSCIGRVVALSLIALCQYFFGAPAQADVTLPAVISDNMVLQQQMPIVVWGKAAAGEKVVVTLGRHRAKTRANAQGAWRVRLPAQRAGGPYELTIAGTNRLTVKDVLIGEVWLASGQSNMEMQVASALHAGVEMAAAHFPQIRMFKVKDAFSAQPAGDVQGAWQVCDAHTVASFSAAGYYFARELQTTLKVPVGIINGAYGGALIESYLVPEACTRGTQAAWLHTVWDTYNKDYRFYFNNLRKWSGISFDAAAPIEQAQVFGNMFNSMIAPLVPYQIRGVIWYQGEANAFTNPLVYHDLFTDMIGQWRQVWGEKKYPFLYVQLPNYNPYQPDANAFSGLAQIREAQRQALTLPDVGMAVTIDIGDAANIHPANKQDVCKRLALLAESMVYHQPVLAYGPLFHAMTIEGAQIRLQFSATGKGLVAHGGDTLQGFAIAGADHKFVWAVAKIDGDSIVVSSPNVPQPVAVRYAWGDNPACNLFNLDGLPASPFRTDAWPIAADAVH